MRRLLIGLFLALVALIAGPHEALAGTCRLSIVVDRSGSMLMQRSDGSKEQDGITPQTRCYAAGVAVSETLDAFVQGKGYDITNHTAGVSHAVDDPEYDTKCPNIADRLVNIQVFQDSQLTQLTPGGFVPVATAATLWIHSPYWSFVASQPLETCNGNTPLAQAMCLSTRVFPAGLPTASEARRGWTFTDGEENFSDTISLTPDQGPRCRLPGESLDPGTGTGGWGDRVIAEYASRGIQGHGFLFVEGATPLLVTQSATTQAAIHEPIEALLARPAKSAAAAAATSPDQVFLTALANQTGGAFTLLPSNVPISSSVFNNDIDGDGIPDWRDFCPFNACSDIDGDGIPDSQDACPVSQREDGLGPFPADGCKDTDGDGIRDGLDTCPTTLEDYFPPNIADGCPRIAAAAPAAPASMIGLLALALLGGAAFALRRKREAC